MAEESRPWAGTTVGDAGPYSDDDWDDIWEILYGSGLAPYNDRGVIRNWLNELEVTDPVVANRVDVDTGAALVHGKFYNNTTLVNVVAIPNSGAPWREDTIFLRCLWATQEIRIYRHQNSADGAPYETPASVDGTVWYIPLAAVRIDAGGVITLITDLRRYVIDLMRGTREICSRPWIEDANPASRGVRDFHPTIYLAVGEDCMYDLVVPPDFKRFIQAVVYVGTSLTGTIDWLFSVDGVGCGELYQTHQDSTTGAAEAMTITRITCIDVSAAFDGLALAPGDLLGMRFRPTASTFGDVNMHMLVFRYE